MSFIFSSIKKGRRPKGRKNVTLKPWGVMCSFLFFFLSFPSLREQTTGPSWSISGFDEPFIVNIRLWGKWEGKDRCLSYRNSTQASKKNGPAVLGVDGKRLKQTFGGRSEIELQKNTRKQDGSYRRRWTARRLCRHVAAANDAHAGDFMRIRILWVLCAGSTRILETAFK